MRATAKDLRFHSRELLAAVERGEEVVITFRGSPCAKLVPYDKGREIEGETELFGIWSDRDDISSVDEYVRDLRKGRS